MQMQGSDLDGEHKS